MDLIIRRNHYLILVQSLRGKDNQSLKKLLIIYLNWKIKGVREREDRSHYWVGEELIVLALIYQINII
jgi:hypothetical protein